MPWANQPPPGAANVPRLPALRPRREPSRPACGRPGEAARGGAIRTSRSCRPCFSSGTRRQTHPKRDRDNFSERRQATRTSDARKRHGIPVASLRDLVWPMTAFRQLVVGKDVQGEELRREHQRARQVEVPEPPRARLLGWLGYGALQAPPEHEGMQRQERGERQQRKTEQGSDARAGARTTT